MKREFYFCAASQEPLSNEKKNIDKFQWRDILQDTTVFLKTVKLIKNDRKSEKLLQPRGVQRRHDN